MVAGEGSLWLLYIDKSAVTVARIDPESMTAVANVDLGNIPKDYFAFPRLVSGEGAIWLNIGDEREGKIIRIDPDSNQVAAVIEVGPLPYPVVVGGGSIWVSTWVTNKGGGVFPLLRIDPRTNQVVERYFLKHKHEGMTHTIPIHGGQPWLIAADDAILAIQDGGVQRLDY